MHGRGRRLRGARAHPVRRVVVRGHLRGPTPHRHGGAVPPPRLTAQDLRILAELLDGGVPLVAALESLARHTRDRGRAERLAGAAMAIAAGSGTPSVLSAGGAHVAALIAAGDRVGRLGEAVAAAAELEERLAGVRRRILGSLAYPLVVLIVAVAVVALVVTTAVPQMAATFDDLGGRLPAPTRLVLGLAELMASPLVPSAVAAGLAGTLVLRRRRSAAPGGGLDRRRVLMGPLGPALDVAVAVRVIGTLLTHGVALTQALDVAASGCADARVRAHLSAVAEHVRGGGRLTASPDLADVLTPSDLLVIGIGEERGILAPQFLRVAERRLGILERNLELVGTLAEPVLVAVVGVLVGGVVAALYLPSFRVLELL